MKSLAVLLYIVAGVSLLIALAELLIIGLGFEWGSIRIGDGSATYIEPETIGALALLLGVVAGFAALTIRRNQP